MAEIENLIKLPLDEQREYYKRVLAMIRWIGDDVQCMGGQKYMHGYYSSGPNPYYNQLDIIRGEETGLVLVEYYGNPSTFATPLGGWTFNAINGKNMSGWKGRLDQRFGIEKVMEEVQNDVGCFGPAYRVLRDLEGKPFGHGEFTPLHCWVPSIICKWNCSYDDAKAIWEQVRPDLDLQNTERET